jgi:hypothetical protein
MGPNFSGNGVMIKHAVFLDFDGVLFDTVREVYCVSMLASGEAVGLSDIDLTSEHFQEFCMWRYLIGPAWNYFYLLELIDKKMNDPSFDVSEGFCGSLENSSQERHCVFEQNFFAVRENLRETCLDDWLSLVVPYKFAKGLCNVLKDRFENFFLITTRDRSSVLQILRKHHLNFLEENVFGKEDYEISNSKRDVICRLIENFQIKGAMLVDDFEGHLADCGDIDNLLPMQAGWGYVPPEKKEDNDVRIIEYIEKFILEKNVWA